VRRPAVVLVVIFVEAPRLPTEMTVVIATKIERPGRFRSVLRGDLLATVTRLGEPLVLPRHSAVKLIARVPAGSGRGGCVPLQGARIG